MFILPVVFGDMPPSGPLLSLVTALLGVLFALPLAASASRSMLMARKVVLWGWVVIAVGFAIIYVTKSNSAAIAFLSWGLGTWGIGAWVRMRRRPAERLAKLRTHVEVVFPLDRQTVGWPPVDVEDLACHPLGGLRYEVDEVPFLAKGVAVGDVVTVSKNEGSNRLQFDRVVRRHGHSTIRVVPGDPGDVTAIRTEFDSLGCRTAWNGPWGLVAIDVPAKADQRLVRSAVEAGSSLGRWSFETGSLAPAWTMSAAP